MNCRGIIWVFVTLFQSITNGKYVTEMVSEYFNLKNIRIVTIFACTTDDYLILLQKTMENYKQVASGKTLLNENISFSNAMHSPYNKMGVFLDYTCDFGKKILSQSSESFILNSSYVWLIETNSTDTLNDLKMLNFGLDSDVVIAVDSNGSNIKDRKINLFDIYKVNSTWPLIIKLAGFYTHENGLNFLLKGSIIQRRHDFNNITFIGSLVIVSWNTTAFDEILKTDFIDDTKGREIDSDNLSRCSYEYYTYLMNMFNFSIKIYTTRSFGYPNRKGSILHDGMVGQLEVKDVDVGLSPVGLHVTTRLDVVQFTVVPIWTYRGLFVFCHPSTLGTYRALVIPFSPQVWIFVSCLTVGVGIILTFIKNISVMNPIDIEKSLSGNIVIAVGALYQQGLSSYSDKIPERIMLLSTLIIGFITVTYYNSMIVESLLQPPPKDIVTPKQLMESPFKIISQNYSYFKDFFERSPDPLIKEIFNKKILKGPGFIQPMEAMKLVQNSKFAFYSYDSIIYKIIDDTYSEEEVCSIQEIELERPKKMNIPLKRNSPLIKYFNCGLLLMQETGIKAKVNKKWSPRKPHCPGNTLITSVKLESVLIAYMILIIGFVTSLLILCAELLLFKFKLKQRLVKPTNKIIIS